MRVSLAPDINPVFLHQPGQTGHEVRRQLTSSELGRYTATMRWEMRRDHRLAFERFCQFSKDPQ